MGSGRGVGGVVSWSEEGRSRSTQVALEKLLESQALVGWGQPAKLPEFCTRGASWQQACSESCQSKCCSPAPFLDLAKMKMTNRTEVKTSIITVAATKAA